MTLLLGSLVPSLILEGMLSPTLRRLPSKNPTGRIFTNFATYSWKSCTLIRSARLSYSTSEEPFLPSILGSPFPMGLRNLLISTTAAILTKLSEFESPLASSRYPAFRMVGSSLYCLFYQSHILDCFSPPFILVSWNVRLPEALYRPDSDRTPRPNLCPAKVNLSDNGMQFQERMLLQAPRYPELPLWLVQYHCTRKVQPHRRWPPYPLGTEVNY